MANKRKSISIKNPKKVILNLTFYMHKNIWMHLLLLYVLNTLITMAILGLFDFLQASIFDTSIMFLFILTGIITLSEHTIKHLMSLKMYAALTRTLGVGTILIIFVVTALIVVLFPNEIHATIEPLIGYATILVFIRFYMRHALIRFQRATKRSKT